MSLIQCGPSSCSSLRASLSWLSTITPASLSLSLSLSLRLTTHRYAHRQLRKLETVFEDTVWSWQAAPFPECSQCTCTSSLLCRWDTPPVLLPLSVSPLALPQFNHQLLFHIHTVFIQRRWCAKAGRLSSEADQPWEAPTATSMRARRRRVACDMRWRSLRPLLPSRPQH